MDFQQSFLDALQSNISLTKAISIYDYLPTSLSLPNTSEEHLPYVQAHGNVKAFYPYYYDISDLDSYCLLFTTSGTGALTLDDLAYTLAPETLVFLDCHEKHRIEIKQSPWNYIVFFIKGPSLAYLYSTIVKQYGVVHTFPIGSSIPSILKNFNDQIAKKPDPFLYTKYIFDIILELIIEKKSLEEHTNHVPDYLNRIKQTFDNNCGKKFSLDMLEREYHISKYQICREFTSQFGVAPIQYLNRARIAISKEALVTTDKRINEIGRMVGFENTNHFIRLFKKQTGVTPLVFRKQSPAFHFFK